ncbi:MAG: SEC59/DGK1/VTE5 family protein [Candidatus Nanohaloarchaea archaeon]|nr:SEC59/DGK1/VTE5 family protein [Candidatus Nanohaloarchaea archaeon]
MRFETRRKLFHVVAGAVAFGLVYTGRYPVALAAAGLLAGIGVSVAARHRRIPGVHRLLDLFERDHHQDAFPGKGALSSLAGVTLVAASFPRPAALAAIGALVAGDSLSHLVGKRYGRVDNPLNPVKDVEGFAAGFLATAAIAALFLPLVTAVVAAFAGMVVESIDAERITVLLDDNLTVPVAVAATAHLVHVYLLPAV